MSYSITIIGNENGNKPHIGAMAIGANAVATNTSRPHPSSSSSSSSTSSASRSDAAIRSGTTSSVLSLCVDEDQQRLQQWVDKQLSLQNEKKKNKHCGKTNSSSSSFNISFGGSCGSGGDKKQNYQMDFVGGQNVQIGSFACGNNASAINNNSFPSSSSSSSSSTSSTTTKPSTTTSTTTKPSSTTQTTYEPYEMADDGSFPIM
jgi:hypothetical protein